MHTLLALDTCGPSLSVALAQGGKIVFEATCQNGLTHSQSLMPLVEQALAAGGLDCSQLDALAAVHGPGSFTGVRIGVETVRALAHAAGKPCFAVSALETLAMGISLFRERSAPCRTPGRDRYMPRRSAPATRACPSRCCRKKPWRWKRFWRTFQKGPAALPGTARSRTAAASTKRSARARPLRPPT